MRAPSCPSPHLLGKGVGGVLPSSLCRISATMCAFFLLSAREGSNRTCYRHTARAHSS